MEYRAIHKSDPSTELTHWKYIKREKKNGKWKYYYKYTKAIKNKTKNFIDDVVDNVKSVTKKPSKNPKDIVSSVSKRKAKGLFFLLPRSVFKSAFDWFKNTLGINSKKDNDKISSQERTGHKYIAKVKLPNGKYRYFYDQDEYDSYLRRLKYQESEPGFMKKVRDIDNNDILTKEENMDKINEKFDPYDPATSTNCSNCSVAYELRMRGYDVEAKLNDSSYNGRGDRFYDYFEDAEVLQVYGDGDTRTVNEDFTRKIWDNKLTKYDSIRYKKDLDYYKEEQTYTASSIEKAIKDNNPPGSRGMIDVDWKSGSAHSIMYEVDKSGKVTIRDSQTYDTYDVSEIADKVSRVRICRTDNLQVKENILNAVKTNTDGEREYYVDENRLIEYDE